MDSKYRKISTTVRLDERESALISQLIEKTGASQSAVIRRLVDIALGDESNFVFSRPGVIPDEEKTMLLEVAEKMAGIATALNRIGGNINIRRRAYNTDRKVIEDRIISLQKAIKYGGSYEKAKYGEELNNLTKKLEECDARVAKMVENDEWIMFKELQEQYNAISVEIERRLSGWLHS